MRRGGALPMLAPMAGPLWQPSDERIEAAALTAFRRHAEARHDVSLPDYAALHAWSLRDPDAFWSDVWSFCEVRGDGPGTVRAGPTRSPVCGSACYRVASTIRSVIRCTKAAGVARLPSIRRAPS